MEILTIIERKINMSEQDNKKDLLVLGIGNFLCGDDGIGPILAERLMSCYREDRHVDVINGGTIGLGLLYLLDSYSAIIFLDAVDVGAEPGTVFEFSPEDLENIHSEKQISSHQSDPCGLLSYARVMGFSPGKVIILGIQIERINNAIGLSDVLTSKLPLIETRVKKEIETLVEQCMNCL